ncbi:MAG: hypothetical protein GX895_14110 [Clostridiales bacterium]|nr:hypothetical protein [Clostridiales bacterium]
MKPKKKKINKTMLTIIITISSALILATVFFATYFIFIDKSLNKYEKNMSSLISQINSINKSSNQLLDNNDINLELAKEKLPSMMKELDIIRNKAEAEIPGDKFKLQHTSLIEGLKSNRIMYMQILNIINSPNSNDLKEYFANFEKYRDDCENYYSEFSVNSLSPSVENEAKNFIKAFTIYSNELINTQEEALAKLQEDTAFANFLDSILERFVPINTNFSLELSEVRNSTGDYDKVIELANKYNNINNDLQKEILNLSSVPQSAIALRDDYIRLSNYYNSFIQSFITAINEEMNLISSTENNKTISEEQLKKIYSDSDNKFLSLQDKYNSIVKDYNTFKEKISE